VRGKQSKLPSYNDMTFTEISCKGYEQESFHLKSEERIKVRDLKGTGMRKFLFTSNKTGEEEREKKRVGMRFLGVL